jgi:thiol-disulfide isomerase/thioredoxin
MNNSYLLLLILILSFLVGQVVRYYKGKVRHKKRTRYSAKELRQDLGSRATIVQFSTTFCSECRAAKAMVNDVVKELTDIAYIELDAESNLDLVRRVDIRSTPTTIFLDKNGYEIARAKGAPKRDQLIKAIQAL